MTPRWRVWLVFGVGVATLGAGMILGHGLVLAIGLGITAVSGVGTAGRGKDAWLHPTDVGGGTDWRAPAIAQGWERRVVARRHGEERPIVDKPVGVVVWALEMDTDAPDRVAMLLPDRPGAGVPAEGECPVASMTEEPR